MKMVKKAIGKKYEFTCYECGILYEAKKEDFIYDGIYIVEIHCPVCDMTRPISRKRLTEIIIYEGEEDS